MYIFLHSYFQIFLHSYFTINTSEKNRFTNALTVGNCKLDMVFSDIFGKSSSAIINTIISRNEFDDDDILNNVHRTLQIFSRRYS